MKGVPFLSKTEYKTVLRFGPRGGASLYKTLLSTAAHLCPEMHTVTNFTNWPCIPVPKEPVISWSLCNTFCRMVNYWPFLQEESEKLYFLMNITQ